MHENRKMKPVEVLLRKRGTQTLYAHMNKRNFKKRKRKRGEEQGRMMVG
jgi:hypothetical protein